MELQRFVTEVIEAVGGMVIPLEYALVNVVLPEEYKEHFSGESELNLAFDFEVAQENPDAEFITFGSSILDGIIDIANTKAFSAVRYGIVERLSVSQQEDKIKRFLESFYDRIIQLKVLNEKKVMGLWAVYHFHVEYISDVQINDEIEIWVNLINQRVSPEMMSAKSNIFYETEPVYSYPYPVVIDIPGAYEVACRQVGLEIENKSSSYFRQADLEKELERIRGYYDDLDSENKKRLERKGATEEKKQEVIQKGEALKLERQKQLQEIENKYKIKAKSRLMHGILYEIPLIKYDITVTTRESSEEKTLFYNPVLKAFE